MKKSILILTLLAGSITNAQTPNSAFQSTEKAKVKCTCCNGKGEVKCTRCNGTGKVKAAIKGAGTWTKDESICPNCLGVGENTCDCCNGTGGEKSKPNLNKATKAY